MENTSLKKMGKISSPKIHRFELRLTEEEKEILQDCSKKSNLKKAEVLIRGLYLFKKQLK